MTFRHEDKTYSLVGIRKKLKSPVFRIEDGYEDKRDFLQMKVGVSYHAYLKTSNKIVFVVRID